MLMVKREKHSSKCWSAVLELSGFTSTKMPLLPRHWFIQLKSTVPQMQCNCSETQEKRGLVCTAILLSLMWFLTALENVFKIFKHQATSPESSTDCSTSQHNIWVFLPPTFGLEHTCRRGLKLEAQSSKSAPRTSSVRARGTYNYLSWRKYTRKYAVQVCVWSNLAREGSVFWTLWKLSLLLDCRSETFLLSNLKGTIKMLLCCYCWAECAISYLSFQLDCCFVFTAISYIPASQIFHLFHEYAPLIQTHLDLYCWVYAQEALLV